MVQNTFLAEVQKLREMAKTTECMSSNMIRQCDTLEHLVLTLDFTNAPGILFPQNDYTYLATWLLKDENQKVFRLFQRSWRSVADDLCPITGWTVDWNSLYKAVMRVQKKI